MNTNKPQEPKDKAASSAPQAVLIKGKRSLNLGAIVLICLVFGFLAGIIWGIWRSVDSFAPLVIGGLYGALFIGGALSLIAVTIDWLQEKRNQKRG